MTGLYEIMSEKRYIGNHYEVIEKVGSGMSGDVFLVKDDETEKALKFLNQMQINVSREDALKNFKNEFKILKKLGHPHVASIYDFGFDEKHQKYYFTTEYIKGLELHKACASQSFETKEKIVIQILRALNYLHTKGIYHFDIKPQNILVSMNGDEPETAKLIDFGLSGFKSPQKRVGTPSYMAPEAIQSKVLDNRTDIYSLGVVIYKIFSGKNPFAGNQVKETLKNHLKVIAEPITEVAKDVPGYWEPILERMLEKDPAVRYAQVSLILRDLNLLSGQKVDVETQDTKLSYLPERGILIGRDDAWQSFCRLFDKQFESEQSAVGAQLLVVSGQRGTGKTRFLNEVKTFSQLRHITVFDDVQSVEKTSETPSVILLDDHQAFDEKDHPSAHPLSQSPYPKGGRLIFQN
jgi:serine/threonine protein kinase